jgi:4-carboxymuconolactone decarboxylase
MARVPLIDETDATLATLIAKLKDARRGKLINLYRALLNSASIAEAWLAFNSAIRFNTALDDQARELAIMRVSKLNGADYQFQIHATQYAPEAGLTPQQIAAIGGSTDWNSSLFPPAQRALLAYADAMTMDIEVSDEIFERLRKHFSNKEIVDLTVLIGAYNMHTRVSRALRIDAESS